ncbi:MAG: AsmA family protein [Acidobacteriota bacterium]
MKLLWRVLKIAIPVIAVLAVLAPYIPAAFLRGSVENALSVSLDRPVGIGDIRFTFFPSGPVPGPGFTLEDVTIHEDPRAGIEPFAHMAELGASIRILSLLRGRLELSGINLGEASINLVKTSEGAWNFQMLLERLKEHDTALPALRMRGGRVDFKFGDTKSVFFFNEADLDVAPSASGTIDIRFSGAPLDVGSHETGFRSILHSRHVGGIESTGLARRAAAKFARRDAAIG